MTALRHRVSEAEKSELLIAKSPRARRFLSRKSLREDQSSDDPLGFCPILCFDFSEGTLPSVESGRLYADLRAQVALLKSNEAFLSGGRGGAPSESDRHRIPKVPPLSASLAGPGSPNLALARVQRPHDLGKRLVRFYRVELPAQPSCFWKTCHSG